MVDLTSLCQVQRLAECVDVRVVPRTSLGRGGVLGWGGGEGEGEGEGEHKLDIAITKKLMPGIEFRR